MICQASISPLVRIIFQREILLGAREIWHSTGKTTFRGQKESRVQLASQELRKTALPSIWDQEK